MAKEDVIELEGKVTELLKGGDFKVRLENGYKMVNIFDFLLNENILKEI